ncbi:MAG: hypothetical protein MN733_20585 [Nitrososphaera sp.]|nr:hypothetical protein [Nitrososphaera sp.]
MEKIRVKYSVTFEALVYAELTAEDGGSLGYEERNCILDDICENVPVDHRALNEMGVTYVDDSFRLIEITDEDGKVIKHYRYP